MLSCSKLKQKTVLIQSNSIKFEAITIRKDNSQKFKKKS